jgi:hypothetical protein
MKHSVSYKMPMKFYGSRITLWSQRTLSFTTRSWMRLIALDTLSIQEPTRCIKTWRRVSGGRGWREKLWSMCRNVTRVEESRPIIWDQSEICNPWAFPSGNRKISSWTSLWVCLAPHVGTTWYGSLWTAWLCWLTLYQYPPCTGPNSMPSSTCRTSSAIMVFWRSLSLIVDLSLWHVLGTTTWMIGHPSHSKLSISSSDGRPDRGGEPNHWRHAPRICSEWWSEMGQTPSTSWVLI